MIANFKSRLKSFPIIKKIVDKRRVTRKFGTELRLLNGENPSRSTHPSIVHYSLNKSATQYVKNILTTCVEENDMVPVYIQDYAFASQLPYMDELSADEMQQYKHIFKPQGYLYTAFGGLVEGIDKLDHYRVVLMTRDPRDILVSEYYSNAYSHPEPNSLSSKNQSFHRLRGQALAQTIDEYALARCEWVQEILERYRSQLLKKYSQVYMTKYIDMVQDFETWLTDLLHACQLDVSPALKKQLVEQHYASRPKAEDQQSQLRKGVAGDYINKLNEETIHQLNDRLADVLTYYQYAS